MQDLDKFAEKLKSFKSAYLAGGIQNRTRPDGWRQDLTEFFSKNNKKVNNPYADNEKIFNPSIMGYKDDGKVYTLAELMRTDEGKRTYLLKQTEENDLYFIDKSDLMIFYLDESAGFGTYTEFRENYDKFKRPVIIVRTIPRNKLPHWIEWRRYLSLIKEKTAIEFKSLSEMKEFFKGHLGFKL